MEAAQLRGVYRFRMESSYIRIKQTFTDYAADCLPPGASAAGSGATR